MCTPWARASPRKVKIRNRNNVKVLGFLVEKPMTMVVGGVGIIFSNGVATGGRDGKKGLKEKKRKRFMGAKLPKIKVFQDSKNNGGERCGLPLGPASAQRTRAAIPVAASAARGPHLARARTGSVQQRRLLVRLPGPSKQRSPLLIIAISAGPRDFLRDVGHGPLRTKLNKKSRQPGSVPVTCSRDSRDRPLASRDATEAGKVCERGVSWELWFTEPCSPG